MYRLVISTFGEFYANKNFPTKKHAEDFMTAFAEGMAECNQDEFDYVIEPVEGVAAKVILSNVNTAVREKDFDTVAEAYAYADGVIAGQLLYQNMGVQLNVVVLEAGTDEENIDG